MRPILFLCVLELMLVGPAAASECSEAAACCGQDHGCCGRCGAKKVCKVVCEMEEVTKTCWVVECEEFCAPVPTLGRNRCGCCGGLDCGKQCGAECQAQVENGVCHSLLERPMVPPKCGKVRCRKTLHKKEVTCQVPVYKCVVVPTCCCQGHQHRDVVQTYTPGSLSSSDYAIPPMPVARVRE